MAVKIRGLDKAIEKLEKVGGRGALKRPMMKAVAHLHDKIAKYPPATAANSPGNGYSWYERGFGTRSRTGMAWPTSETLGRRWSHEVDGDGRRGVVGNNASYGPYVQSAEKQAAFHARDGWLTDEQVVEKEQRKVVGFFDDEVRDLTQ
ncbi:protein of unknown function [Candidatus Promineifilum breve]|uniref:HK97 gp10 family phage protein n=1 Tax=Candidatus Promineifilum breve TaxID=1806508 RepID=A0A170PJB9_9CHLR|nr:hypothetical protein [Candidatus Promineifilum breve]CUS05413.2 protein of unknown function [Candidatus Promineifilum breve]